MFFPHLRIGTGSADTVHHPHRCPTWPICRLPAPPSLHWRHWEYRICGLPSNSGHRRPTHSPAPVSVHHHRSEEHTSELQSLMRISYAVICLQKKIHLTTHLHQKHKTH